MIPSSFPSAVRASTLLSCLALALFVSAESAAQSGLDTPEPVGPFLNGLFPPTTPGDGSQIGYRPVDAFPNLRFDDPLVFTPLPGTNRIFVASRDGYFESFVNDPATATKSEMLDLTNTTAVVWDGGTLGLAFHPLFGQSVGRDYAYIYYCARPPGASYPGGSTNGFFGTYLRLSRFDLDPATYVADPASELIMLNLRLYNGSHRGGGMVFGDDGYLYVTIGDQFRYETAQDLEMTLEGGVMRLDVDANLATGHVPRRRFPDDAGEPDEVSGVGYTIPNDNPFLDVSGGIFEEYYTVGHRAPHRLTKDMRSGRLWVGEIGQVSREEINVIERGFNYGWPFREGTIDGVRPAPSTYYGTLKEPVLDFERSEAIAIIGGYVYRSLGHPELYGRYVCGGYAQNRIWAIDYDPATGVGTKEYLTQFTPGLLSTFGQDLEGEIYLCGLGQDVPIYKLARQSLNGPAPALLSQTGAFTDLASLTPAPGVMPYSLNQPAWWDGAETRRWMAIPNDGTHDLTTEQIAYSEEGDWDFPVGTVLVQHFELPVDDTNPSIVRRLETRFLVRGDAGVDYGVTYKWRADGSDADLLTAGLDDPVEIATATGSRFQNWHYPSSTACLTCHTSAAGGVLGPKTRQLNGDQFYDVTGRTANQLITLSALGALDTNIDAPKLPQLLTATSVADDTASREHRVRSYVDANCSYCHRPGTGNRGQFDARLPVPLTSQGLLYGPVTNGLGIAGARVIKPQDPSLSVMYQRMATVIPGVAMPPLAKAREDQVAVQLMESWISLMAVDRPINVARGTAVSQSSTLYGGLAELAIDTSTDGVYTHGSVTHTANEFQPWWEIDLGQVYYLTEVVLWNRTDCCGDRLADFHIFVSSDPFVSTDLITTQGQVGVDDIFHLGPASTTSTHPVQRKGRYLRVQLAATNVLSLAEVQILANLWPGQSVQTVVLGNSTVGDSGHDAWVSNLVIDEATAYTNSSGTLESWRVDQFDFYAWQSTDPVTPFVVRVEAEGVFTVLVVGTTRDAGQYVVGQNAFPFDKIGSRLLELQPGETIACGFLDSAADGSQGGAGSVIPFDDAGNEIWITGGGLASDAGAVVEGVAPTAGSIVETDLQRTYRFAVQLTNLEDIVPTPTAVEDQIPGVVADVTLAAARPNPFNAATELALSLSATGHVDWGIYDSRGRLVYQLARGLLVAGSHTRSWNGVDMRGQSVSSGVYYQRLSVAGLVRGNKFALVK